MASKTAAHALPLSFKLDIKEVISINVTLHLQFAHADKLADHQGQKRQ
jgi:hypothetical protein